MLETLEGNKMNIEDWEREISTAFHSQGKEYTAELRRLMFSTPDTATKDEVKFTVVEVTNVMQRYFWKKAVAGKVFGNVERIREKFGKSLEENYGLSSGPFLNVARTYWTYQIEVGDLFPEHSNKWISHALQAVEINVRELFFPTPGPMTIPTKIRRTAQKEFLEEFVPEINIERFLNENPILRSDSKSGCLGVVVVFSVVAVGLAAYGILV